MPLSSPSEASFKAFLISSQVAGFSRTQVRSTTETFEVGTRMDMPVSFPLRDGITLPTALAAPVLLGMMFWVAVYEWMVVMRPSFMPKVSLMTLARGERQLVVQEALEMTGMSDLYSLLLTPMTNIGASAEGAEMTTFFAPPFKWAEAFSVVVKTPVDSTMYCAPVSDHGVSAGSFFM